MNDNHDYSECHPARGPFTASTDVLVTSVGLHHAYRLELLSLSNVSISKL